MCFCWSAWQCIDPSFNDTCLCIADQRRRTILLFRVQRKKALRLTLNKMRRALGLNETDMDTWASIRSTLRLYIPVQNATCNATAIDGTLSSPNAKAAS